MFIVLEPFGHFVVGEVVQEVQLLKISTDPKQRKSVTIKPSHKHFGHFQWDYHGNIILIRVRHWYQWLSDKWTQVLLAE